MANTPQPAEKSVALIQQLGRMALQPVLDTLAIARARNEAAQLVRIQAHAHSGYMVLAIADEIEGKGDEALANFNRALALAPRDQDVRSNYAVTLERMGRFDEAISIRQALAIESPDDIGQFRAFAHTVDEACRFDLFPSLADRAQKLKLEDELTLLRHGDWNLAVAHLAQLGGTLDDLTEIASWTRRFLRGSGFRIHGTETMGTFEDHVHRRYQIFGSAEEAAQLSYEMAYELGKRDKPTFAEVMTFGCSTYSYERLRPSIT